MILARFVHIIIGIHIKSYTFNFVVIIRYKVSYTGHPHTPTGPNHLNHDKVDYYCCYINDADK